MMWCALVERAMAAPAQSYRVKLVDAKSVLFFYKLTWSIIWLALSGCASLPDLKTLRNSKAERPEQTNLLSAKLTLLQS